MSVLVILATYNERDNIGPLVAEVLASSVAPDVLVVDDNSPDGTGRIAERLAAVEPRVHVMHRPGKGGLGSATIDGMRFAIARGDELAVVMDADFSHPPRFIEALVDAAAECDVAVGSRYITRGGIVGWPMRRRILSGCANGLTRFCLGLRVRDCTGSFRCYRLSKMSAVLDRMKSVNYNYLEEILYRCRSAGMTLVEVPILFEERRAGDSKLNWRELAGSLRVVLNLGLDRLVR